jgi:hypothetical protein
MKFFNKESEQQWNAMVSVSKKYKPALGIVGKVTSYKPERTETTGEKVLATLAFLVAIATLYFLL